MTPRSARDKATLCASITWLTLVCSSAVQAQEPAAAPEQAAPETPAGETPPPESVVAPPPSSAAATTMLVPAPAPVAAPPPEAAAPPPPPPPPLKFGATYFTRYELRSGDLPVIGNRPLNADTLFYRARGNNDLCAFHCVANRNRFANATTGTGNHGDLARQQTIFVDCCAHVAVLRS